MSTKSENRLRGLIAAASQKPPHSHLFERAYNSRVVIDACIPFERRESFPKVAQTSRKLAAEVRAKFPGVFD